MGFYIIEINDKYKQVVLLSADGELYCKDVAGLMPYTEPDTNEAYQRGVEDGAKSVENWNEQEKKLRMDEAYQKGLSDAWKAARKIALMDTETSENVTGYFGLFRIMENLTPMQAIEKIRQYEQRQEEQDGLRQNIQTIVDQCGYTLDEIAAVLEKMREANNG